MKKNITKEEEKALLEIAKRLMAAVDSRGDLEAPDTAPRRGLCHGWQNNPSEPTTPQTGADVAAWMRQEGEAHGRTDDGCHRGNLQPHGRQR